MNVVKKIGLILAALMLTVSVVSPAFSQTDEKKHKQEVELKEAGTKNGAFGSPAWGAGIGDRKSVV